MCAHDPAHGTPPTTSQPSARQARGKPKSAAGGGVGVGDGRPLLMSGEAGGMPMPRPLYAAPWLLLPRSGPPGPAPATLPRPMLALPPPLLPALPPPGV